MRRPKARNGPAVQIFGERPLNSPVTTQGLCATRRCFPCTGRFRCPMPHCASFSFMKPYISIRTGLMYRILPSSPGTNSPSRMWVSGKRFLITCFKEGMYRRQPRLIHMTLDGIDIVVQEIEGPEHIPLSRKGVRSTGQSEIPGCTLPSGRLLPLQVFS